MIPNGSQTLTANTKLGKTQNWSKTHQQQKLEIKCVRRCSWTIKYISDWICPVYFKVQNTYAWLYRILYDPWCNPKVAPTKLEIRKTHIKDYQGKLEEESPPKPTIHKTDGKKTKTETPIISSYTENHAVSWILGTVSTEVNIYRRDIRIFIRPRSNQQPRKPIEVVWCTFYIYRLS